MFEEMILEINNIGPISQATLNLGKNINLVGGVNGSGKTTLSKLLYCFLTTNTKERFKIANKDINSQIKNLIIELKRYIRDKEYLNQIEKINKNLDLNNVNEEFNKLKEIINNSNININGLKKEIVNIEKSINIVENDYDKLNDLIMKNLINSEFGNFEGNTKLYGNNNNKNIEYIIDYENNTFTTKGLFDINDVIYIDSISTLDEVYKKVNNGNDDLYHNKALFEKLKNNSENNIFDEVINNDIIRLCKKIDTLIGGEVKFDPQIEDFVFVKDDKKYLMKNTASGVKQIAILQILLKNRMISENNLIILDEPEVNLHQYWQLKFAEIITKISKELNIMFFINTHSPILIEALEVYTAKENLRETCRFFLTEPTEDDKCTVRRISRKKLYELYDNLGNPYDEIDKIRAKNVINNILDDVG